MELYRNFKEQLKKWCIQLQFKKNYFLNRIIGNGNYATVYLATRMDTQTKYAIKIFYKQLLQ